MGSHEHVAGGFGLVEVGKGRLLELAAGQAEVTELDVVVVVGKDVLWLEIAMEYLDGG
jgi:hypothetical protein